MTSITTYNVQANREICVGCVLGKMIGKTYARDFHGEDNCIAQLTDSHVQ